MKIKKAKLESFMQYLEQQGKTSADQKVTIDNLENEKAQLQTQIEQLNKTRDELTHQIQERDAQIVREQSQQNLVTHELQTQIEQLNKTRDELTHQIQERDARLAQVNHDLANTERKLNEYQQKIEQLQNQVRAGEDYKQENELILLQLHQVQEELERYFILHQDAQNKLQETESRWNKFMEKNPDYCEWDEIKIVQADSELQSVRWEITGLLFANRILPKFEITTSIIQDNPTLIFNRPLENNEPLLLNWPTDNPENVILRTMDIGDQDEQSPYLLLTTLGTTDWRLTKNICGVLVNYVQSQSADMTDKLDLTYWQEQLNLLYQQIKESVAWRYDQCTIKREYVVPGYEHLWFKLDNAIYGARSWANFEFRVGAALVTPKIFSIHPRFEFPLPHEGAKQFENWFEESHDGFGPKYELRFELTNMAIDIGAWQALSLTDQKQMWAIAKDLPHLLTRLEKSGRRIARPWDDWHKIAAGILKTMSVRAQLKTTGVHC